MEAVERSPPRQIKNIFLHPEEIEESPNFLLLNPEKRLSSKIKNQEGPLDSIINPENAANLMPMPKPEKPDFFENFNPQSPKKKENERMISSKKTRKSKRKSGKVNRIIFF